MMQKIILNMITAEDNPVIIERCLRSVLPIIDGWVIADNGSSDEVLDLIRGILAGIPGVLHQVPWVDFGTNRTQGIALARDFARARFPEEMCYIFTLDADEKLHIPDGWKMPDLRGGALYGFEMNLGGVVYPRPNFMNLDLDWSFVGPMHEELICGNGVNRLILLAGPWVEVKQEGKRSKDPERYLKDAETLRKAYEKEAKPRYLFYRAQALRGAGKTAESIEAYWDYLRVADVENERWYSHLMIARLLEDLNEDPVGEYMEAYNLRPWRIESMGSLSVYFDKIGKANLAILYAKTGLNIPDGPDVFFKETLWRKGILEELCCRNFYKTGQFRECIEMSYALLNRNDLSEGERDRIMHNIKSCAKHLEKR